MKSAFLRWLAAFSLACLVTCSVIAWAFMLAVLLAGCGGGEPVHAVETKPMERAP